MADFTKLAIEQAAKEILSKKPISKIKISEITDACGVNRQTFYYHFDDIYDLLKYLFTTEALKYYASEGINPNSIEPKDITLAIFHFMRNNRTLILNSYDSDHRVQYSEMIKTLISPIITDRIEAYTKDKDISEDKKAFAFNFFYYVFSGFILHWLDDGLPDDSVVHLDYYLDVMDGSLEMLMNKLKSDESLQK